MSAVFSREFFLFIELSMTVNNEFSTKQKKTEFAEYCEHHVEQ